MVNKKLGEVFKMVKLTILISFPIVLLCLPTSFLDGGDSICLSAKLFHVQCWGCGLTRGMMHLIHLDFVGAYDYNKLSFLILPLLGIVWIGWIFEEIKNP